MTDYRPASVVEWTEDATRYPAAVIGPDVLSDDVSPSSYVLFPGRDVDGKRSAAKVLFDGLSSSTFELRLLVEPQVLDTQMQVFGASLDDAALFDVNPLWGVAPPVAELTWVSTGEVTASGSVADGFYVGLVNQSPTTGLSADIYLYEMVLVVPASAVTDPPVLRVYPRPDGRGNLSSARRVWPPSKTVQDLRWQPFGGGYR